jgi:hypothetical protein
MSREKQILSVLSQKEDGCTIPELVEIIYQGYATELQKAAQVNVFQHLNKLKEDGAVQSSKESKYVQLDEAAALQDRLAMIDETTVYKAKT